MINKFNNSNYKDQYSNIGNVLKMKIGTSIGVLM